MHRNLSTFWEAGNLPYAHGFISYVWIFNLLILVNFIWLFGFIAGLIITLLTFFQILFTSIFWIFLIPGIILDNRKSDHDFMESKSKPNKAIYSGWGFIIPVLLIFTIINFFIGEYYSLTDGILELVDGDYIIIGMYCLFGIFGGNVLRIITMKLLIK